MLMQILSMCSRIFFRQRHFFSFTGDMLLTLLLSFFCVLVDITKIGNCFVVNMVFACVHRISSGQQ